MRRILSRLYLIAVIAGTFGMFAVSPMTRDYATQAFSSADSAYHFYDDFPIETAKPVFPFQILTAASLFLIYRASDRRRFENRRFLETAVYLIGAFLILLWPASSMTVMLLLFVLAYPWKRSSLPRAQVGWLFAALFVIALLFRLEKLPNVAHEPLQPDSWQYVHYSQTASGWYDTHQREPLWVWVNGILSTVFPVPDDLDRRGYLPIRIVTILLSSAAPILIYLFGRRWISHPAGFAAALLMAANKSMVYRSLQGLREELLILGTLAFLWSAWNYARTRNLFDIQTLSLGAASAALLLLRISCLPLVVLLLLWAAWSGRQTWKQILLAGAIGIAPIIPFFINCAHEYGDPFYINNWVIRFYYHAVFGQYPAEPLSAFQFMFQIFTWYESILYTALGTLDTFAGRYALRICYFPFSAALIGCSLVGYVLWLIRPERRIMAFSALLLLGPMGFFMGILIHSATVFDWRLVVHLYPFIIFAGAEGFSTLIHWAGWGNAFVGDES